MKKRLLFFLCLWNFSANAEVVDKTLAVVGKELILQSDVKDLLSRDPSGVLTFDNALESLIDRDVTISECKKFTLYPSDNEVKQQISDIKKQYNLDDSAFERELIKMGISLEKYESSLYFEICKSKLIQNKIKSRVNITKEDVARALKARTGKERESKLRMRSLVVTPALSTAQAKTSAKDFAQSLYNKLIAGASFEELAKSDFDGLKISELDFGLISRSDTVSAIADAVFVESDSKIRGPVEIDNGFYVFEILERVQDESNSLVAEEKDLHKQLFEMEIERLLKQYLAEARYSTFVDKL